MKVDWGVFVELSECGIQVGHICFRDDMLAIEVFSNDKIGLRVV